MRSRFESASYETLLKQAFMLRLVLVNDEVPLSDRTYSDVGIALDEVSSWLRFPERGIGIKLMHYDVPLRYVQLIVACLERESLRRGYTALFEYLSI